MIKFYRLFFLLSLIYIFPYLAVIPIENDGVVISTYAKSVQNEVATPLMANTVSKNETINKIKKELPQKVAYLTFDDGPSDTVTPEILKTLKKNNIQATFFMLGKNINNYQSVAKSVYDSGHVIGNHTYTHRYTSIKSLSGFKNEIIKTNKVIKKITGYQPWLYRNPYGYKLSKDKKKFLNLEGMKAFTWNVDCKDTRGKNVPADKIFNSVAWSLSGKKDIVVILHDCRGHHQTAVALQKIIDELKRKGYTFKALTKDAKVNAKVEIK